jgi:chromosome segregation ATPase
VYLKALEIQGFKSFPDKVRLDFEHELTAIIGPNGSGEIEYSDAICWVMGEQRSKTLRGAKMEDVVFSGEVSGAAQASRRFRWCSTTARGYCIRLGRGHDNPQII